MAKTNSNKKLTMLLARLPDSSGVSAMAYEDNGTIVLSNAADGDATEVASVLKAGEQMKVVPETASVIDDAALAELAPVGHCEHCSAELLTSKQPEHAQALKDAAASMPEVDGGRSVTCPHCEEAATLDTAALDLVLAAKDEDGDEDEDEESDDDSDDEDEESDSDDEDSDEDDEDEDDEDSDEDEDEDDEDSDDAKASDDDEDSDEDSDEDEDDSSDEDEDEKKPVKKGKDKKASKKDDAEAEKDESAAIAEEIAAMLESDDAAEEETAAAAASSTEKPSAEVAMTEVNYDVSSAIPFAATTVRVMPIEAGHFAVFAKAKNGKNVNIGMIEVASASEPNRVLIQDLSNVQKVRTFQKLFVTALDANEDLSAFGFSPIVHTVPVAALQERVTTDIETAAYAEAEASIKAFRADFANAISIAAAAMNRGLYDNPLSEALASSLTSKRVSGAASVAAGVVASASDDYFKTVLEHAQDLMKKSPEARAEIASMVARTKKPAIRATTEVASVAEGDEDGLAISTAAFLATAEMASAGKPKAEAAPAKPKAPAAPAPQKRLFGKFAVAGR